MSTQLHFTGGAKVEVPDDLGAVRQAIADKAVIEYADADGGAVVVNYSLVTHAKQSGGSGPPTVPTSAARRR